MSEPSVQGHTLATDYVRQLKKANEDLVQTAKYLDPESPHYLPAYIQNLIILKDSPQPPAGIEQKIALMQANWLSYQQRAARAKQVLSEYPAKLKALAATNDFFLAPAAKQSEYLYMVDEESGQASTINWDEFATESYQQVNPSGQRAVFKGKDNIQLTLPEQTDAVRVWSNHVVVDGLIIRDQRTYTEAHRDAIQLIPPALGRREGDQYRRLADQMAGTIMENVTIQNCQISAPNGPLQGIFASDGMQRQLVIRSNLIATKGAHSISLAGVLEGCEISGNRLQAVAGGELPKINLYPARIGGNIADDGVVCILGFAAEPKQLSLEYAPILVQAANQILQVDGTETEAQIHDMRRVIPESFMALGLGLTEFRYHAYLAHYSSLSLGEYRQFDPFGAQQLETWLTQRIHEFSEGRADGHPLGSVGAEQQAIGDKLLQPALKALQSGSVEQQRLVDLDYSPIRSFAMKRLAIMHAQVQPLIHLGLANQRRELALQFVLEPSQLRNLVKLAYLDVRVLFVGTRQAAAHLPFTLFFDPDHYYTVTSNAQGELALADLPLGACILIPTDPKLSLSLAALNKPLKPASLIQVASGLAQSLLNELRRKTPVLDAYLRHFPAQEIVCFNQLASYLNTVGVTSNILLSEAIRRDGLTLLGVMSSQTAANRRTSVLAITQNINLAQY
ncbi:hypothetical protein SAMN02745130_02292 [Thiothrix eikelboomii]|uniref:Uncharacterized protein n=1 Tax=Thiothrix eikelboomii TaxID=92487 RepID=A0A1T4WYN6_9GAMM|nr:hypothetical protein [Thiothrix eikelboomii]SKA82424.1 hypothetical protein SAMN02745130_02292 [Thiothrix eikelboomii]